MASLKLDADTLFKKEFRNNIIPTRTVEANILPVSTNLPVDNFVPRFKTNAPNLNVKLETKPFRNHTLQINDAGNVVRLKSGIDLDLTSGSRSIVLGKNLFQDRNSIEITAGGETKTLSAGSLVSAA
ncbi:MAG: hypothetical protein SGJ27_17985 [Candidatus Melainabacteria bacterium]|nr:hypothetical protein [Candidatus Melainabacteria bacterium]